MCPAQRFSLGPRQRCRLAARHYPPGAIPSRSEGRHLEPAASAWSANDRGSRWESQAQESRWAGNFLEDARAPRNRHHRQGILFDTAPAAECSACQGEDQLASIRFDEAHRWLPWWFLQRHFEQPGVSHAAAKRDQSDLAPPAANSHLPSGKRAASCRIGRARCRARPGSARALRVVQLIRRCQHLQALVFVASRSSRHPCSRMWSGRKYRKRTDGVFEAVGTTRTATRRAAKNYRRQVLQSHASCIS